MTTNELKQSIQAHIEHASEFEERIYQLQGHIVYLQAAQEHIADRYVLEGVQGSNEKQRQAWLASALAEDEEYQRHRDEERETAELLAASERELWVTDRLRRLEMVLLQLHVDRRGEDHGTA